MEKILRQLHEKYKTQSAIADAFGVEQPAVAQWFSRSRLPLSRAPKAAKLLGIDPLKILELYE